MITALNLFVAWMILKLYSRKTAKATPKVSNTADMMIFGYFDLERFIDDRRQSAQKSPPARHRQVTDIWPAWVRKLVTRRRCHPADQPDHKTRSSSWDLERII
jgi:hypothetical protein